MDWDALLRDVAIILDAPGSTEDGLRSVCSLLYDSFMQAQVEIRTGLLFQ